MADLVHLRLDRKTRDAIKTILKREHFTTETDFIRDAIRKNLETYERVEGLRQLQGAVKPRKHPPKSTPSDIFRAFGLDKVPEVDYVARDENLSAPFARKHDVKRVGEVRRNASRG